MSFRLSTAANVLHRPHLITPQAAEYWAERMRELDGRAFRRPSRFDALARKLGLGRERARAWDDDDDSEGEPAPTRPVAYAPLWMGEPDKQLDWGWSVKDGVAMMEIAGPLVEKGGWGWCDFVHGYDTISAAIDEFDADSSAKGGIIRFDTPGGVVASGIYDLAVKLQTRGPDAKPLWAICEMACSAGYWIASQFDNVVAPQAGLIGSIGAVIVHESYAGALEKAGISVQPIQFGASKTDGAWFKALSDTARADLQSMIDEIGVTFCDTVGVGREGKMNAEQARATEARVFSAVHSDPARSALSLGLIDAVMSEQQAFDAMKAATAETNIIPIRPAAQAAVKPAAIAATPEEEDDMKIRAKVAAILAAKPNAKTAEEKLADIQKILDEEEEGEEPDAPDEEQVAAEDGAEEEEETEARAGKPKPAAAVDSKGRIKAILALPEAKGREAQAQHIALETDLTIDQAKGLLASAPKASRLAERVTDPTLTGDGGNDKRSDVKKESDAALRAAGIRVG
jgi:capsid assembly protease